MKRDLIHISHKETSIMYREHQDLCNEITVLRPDLQLNSSPQGITDLVINSKGSSHPSKDEKPLGSVFIP
jgi:hypothetical protein